MSLGLALGIGIGPFGSQVNSRLASFAVGTPIVGESFARTSVANQSDVNGQWSQVLANVKRDSHFIGGVRTLLLEASRTNIALHKRDMTNASWVKTTTTAAKDQTGIDGAANGASSLLATGINATTLQTVTLASSARFQSAFVKRLVGVGNIDMTTDGGTTWTTISGSINGATYTRVSIPSQTVLNPVFGFRIAASGDKIAVDWAQNENGAFVSSPIGTLTDNAAAETRAGELYGIPVAPAQVAFTGYAKFIDLGTIVLASSTRVWEWGTNAVDPRITLITNAATKYRVSHTNASTVSSTAAASPVPGDTVECRAVVAPDGSVTIGQAVNGAAEVVAAASAAQPFVGNWSAGTIWVNGTSAGGAGFIALQALKILAGTRSLAEMQAA